MQFIAGIAYFAVAALAVPIPPDIPSGSDAKSALAQLTVADAGSLDGYDRDLFKTWITIEGKCDTREYVLKRDGTNVVVDSACEAQSGDWISPYEVAEFTDASDLDIDHMVPLANAWISGASEWTASQRQNYANDVTRPQLWAVSAHENRSKGDSSPDEWKPASTAFYCTYAEAWTQVKSYYDLTITAAEKSALSDMLDTC